MNHRERPELQTEELQDQQIMQQLMKAEGQQLLKLMEELEEDPEAAPPAELEQRCLETLAQAGRTPRRSLRRTAVRVFRYLAAAMLAASLIFITAFAAFEEVRVGTLKLLVEITGSYAHYKLVPVEEPSGPLPQRLPAADTETLLGYRFPAMPAGFAPFREYKTTTQSSVQYRREDGAEIFITVSYYAMGNSSFPTGDAQMEDVSVQGYNGQLIYRRYLLADGRSAPWSNLLWGNTDAGVLVSIIGYRVEGQTLLELAEQAEWTGLSENADKPTLMGYQITDLPRGFWLEAYGRTETEHYARYLTSQGETLQLRVSTEELNFDEFEKYLSDRSSITDTTLRGYPARICHRAWRPVTVNGQTRHYPNEILLWTETDPTGAPIYLWLESAGLELSALRNIAEALRLMNEP